VSEHDPVHDDWERFRTQDTMTDHWDRPGWTPGRRSLHWFLTFDSPALRDLAGICQHQLRTLDCLDPVPADGLHLTLRRLAFTDEIDAATVTTIIQRVSDRCRRLPAVRLRVGPLAGSRGAVRFTVAPWEALLEIRDVLDEAAAVCGLPGALRRFRPHVGIAYCNRGVPAAPIIRRVATLRDLPPVEVHVEGLRLVRLYRDGRTYRWDTEAIVPLSA
jgi:2'-5' RNA ligase